MSAREPIRPAPRMRLVIPGCALLLLATTLPAQDFSVNWWTVDGGGEVLSESADEQWQLSGTLGQWDSTSSRALAGGGWTLSGGFWPATVTATDADRIFADSFED